MINTTVLSRVRIAVACLFVISSCKQSARSYQKIVLKNYITDTVPYGANGLVVHFNERGDGVKFSSINTIDSVKVGTVQLQDLSGISSSINEKTELNSSFKVALIYGSKYKWICFDTDNDGNFENEELQRLDTFKNSVVIKNVDLYDGEIHRKRDVIAKYAITPINTDGIVVFPYYHVGNFIVDSIEFKFALCASFFAAEYNRESAILFINNANEPFKNPKEHPVKYKVGDTIYFSSKSFRFAVVSKGGDTISLEELTDNALHYGIEPGQYAFPIQATDISNGRTFTIGKSGKYTLIDFWGTWCGPCKEIMPELKALYRQAAEKNFDIVSVAFDSSMKDVANYIQDENVKWINLFDDRNNSVICKKFKIEAFPTLILLDESGKIVFREIGNQKGMEMARRILLR
ncbi:TlpA disulfide reductase family protein [Danxiaibacter flavus]|uniref:TlpA disulfide reductase family protein n=1 Tax=Danxiaibacter flavus TaxID=3049108 RepID=A0ABV3ZKZ7_9BACT|nr:TlpA disulfide reductase family protein [Chitinophagaceae bacterium DXS]